MTERRDELEYARSVTDSYGLLLLVVAATIFLLGLVDLSSTETIRQEIAAILVTLLSTSVLLLALHMSAVSRRWLLFSAVLALLVVVGTVLTVALERDIRFDRFFSFLWLLVIITAPLVVLRRILQHRKVTQETIFGAICVFLLFAIAYNFAFLFINGLTSDEFFADPQPTTAFMYFTLVTITTLGYGDLAPVPEFARIIAASAAVVGQVYLVVIVARLVSLYTGQSRRRRVSRSGQGET